MGLEGMLTDMPLVDLLRVLLRGARSGKLILWNESEWVITWFQRGQIVSAVVLSKQAKRPLYSGEEAVFQLFTWDDGQFCFTPETDSDNYLVTIRRSTSTLIAEGLRRRSVGAMAPTAVIWSCVSLWPSSPSADSPLTRAYQPQVTSH